GKSVRGSPPRRRVVLSVFPWAVAGVKRYLDDVRPRFFTRYEDMGALFPTERRGWISPRQIAERFADIPAAAGLDTYLNQHFLRHTYVTTLIERGWPVALVQKQA